MMSAGWFVFCLVALVGIGLSAARSPGLFPPVQRVVQMKEAPKPCCTPKQWEATLSEVIGYELPKQRSTGALIDVIETAYDATGKRMSLDEHIILNDKPIQTKVILNFKEGRLYIIQDSGCTYQKLQGDFPESCIPANANYTGSYTLGYGKESLTFDAWSFILSADEGSYVVYVNMTPQQCIPVTEVAMGGTDEVNSLATVGVINLSLGIKDPSVFTPPSGCKPTEVPDNAMKHPTSRYFLSKFK